ncbi:endolytic transglycosylase MltG [Mycobacterium sp. CVI_P3]|uniref:Endolytic murein transglycosylase n=1 Tax=Mycobacterium pinniadriaticum TaxID=2994102 RepID=A0ABT3SB56_9MYCO|nr:endolytic transglycosylase MltG [Mycobacterium pinniadriaticum]MCX2930326.1 endolytic transglycosylase MltG [Mycobacterium pinniadriaticum]MCX2936612.1 endolytic transglycosylase MltG [Mycobacterium pinniadriaticum]
MSDDFDYDRSAPVAVGRPRARMSRLERVRARRNRNRRRMIGAAAAALLTVVVVAAVFLGAKLFSGSGGGFTGEGKDDVIIQVHDGDSTTQIGQTLREANAISTVKGFVDAAKDNATIAAIQPGFYLVKTEMSAPAAVRRLADPHNRVGKLVIPEGRQLDDVAEVGSGKVTDGIFTLISKATCVQLNGQRRCVPAADLRKVAEQAPPAALNVPQWAIRPVTALGTNHRRLEGLIAPGTWNVDPLASPQEIVAKLVGQSADHYVGGGLLDTATAMNMSPYQILIVGSLVQREAKPHDFAKVARVIYNRLAVPQKLEFDSTVNYPLDRQEVATTDADRAQVTPWNTYAAEGLPATPICSPGDDALAAAERPEPGDWLYFVTVDTGGTTLFTRDYEQHLANIELARHNGVLDSAR